MTRKGCNQFSTVAAPVAHLVVALSLAAAGCGEEDLTGREDVAVVRGSVILNTDFQDGTGTILVRVKTCEPTPSAFTNCAYCVVDPGWARAGGGGQIVGESNPGAMLQASFPSPNSFSTVNSYGCTGPGGGGFNTAWVVRSSGANHVLQAYVVGLQIRNGVNGIPFAPQLVPKELTTDAVNPPANATIEISEADIAATTGIWGSLIGGGAEIVNQSLSITEASDSFLTESRPVDGPNGRAWRASARSQSTPAQDNPLITYGIVAPGCEWSNFDCFTTPSIRSVVAAATSGYGTATHTLPASWVTTSVGGRSPSTSGGGRYLADLIPLNGSQKGFTVRSKANNTVAATGGTTGYALAFGRTQAPYTFNAIRFNGNSTALYRPTGTNPQLQQSTLHPDAPALRWHLENVGNGVFRVRNGNPDSGTECAYRASSTTVRVTTCGTGNEFRWTALSGTIYTGPFQLRNLGGTNQCLDNNNQGSINGNLTLKTCSAGSAAQVVFLDHYSWPPL
jgi:hypothetical protein